jgi:hypothetical protein
MPYDHTPGCECYICKPDPGQDPFKNSQVSPPRRIVFRAEATNHDYVTPAMAARRDKAAAEFTDRTRPQADVIAQSILDSDLFEDIDCTAPQGSEVVSSFFFDDEEYEYEVTVTARNKTEYHMNRSK